MAKILKSALPYKAPTTENLVEFIAQGLSRNKDCTILIDNASRRQWTGSELESTLAKLVNYLRDECGVKKGDRCIIWGSDCDISAILILAVICTGGTSTYMSLTSTAAELKGAIGSLNCGFLISESSLLENAAPGLEDEDIQVLSIDKLCDGFRKQVKLIPSDCFKNTLLDEGKNSLSSDFLPIDPERDIAVVQFSSGTTGKPKPIPRTHKNLCHLIASTDNEELMDLKPGVVLSGTIWMTHRAGLSAILSCVHFGNTFAIASGVGYNVDEALALIQRYRVNIFSITLPFFAAIVNQGVRNKSRYDLSSLKHIVTNGGALVNEELPKLLVDEFKLLSLRQCYGMTEVGWISFVESSKFDQHYLSVGHVNPSMEAVVLDRETLKPVAANVPGEVAVRGPQIFPGYLTSEPGEFNRSDFTEDGWFRTGDQGYYDKDEYIHLMGRFKELLILSNNRRWFPNELEAIITEHPGIECVCVVKVGESRQDYAYDLARAYVTLKGGCNVTEKEIIDFVTSKSPNAIFAGGVRIMDQFPKLSNGKINKQHLKTLK